MPARAGVLLGVAAPRSDVDIVPVGAALDAYRWWSCRPCRSLRGVRRATWAACHPGTVRVHVLAARTGFPDTSAAAARPAATSAADRRTRVESLRPGLLEHAHVAGESIEVGHWLEHVESAIEPALASARGAVSGYRNGRFNYLACWPPAALLRHALARCVPRHQNPPRSNCRRACASRGVATCTSPSTTTSCRSPCRRMPRRSS